MHTRDKVRKRVSEREREREREKQNNKKKIKHRCIKFIASNDNLIMLRYKKRIRLGFIHKNNISYTTPTENDMLINFRKDVFLFSIRKGLRIKTKTENVNL